MNHAIPPDLIPLLRCPKCRNAVSLQANQLVCQNDACGLRYPILDGIPVMLIEEASPPAPRASEPAPSP